MKDLIPQNPDPHRHDRNPFAISHAINSIQTRVLLKNPPANPHVAHALAIERLYLCYQQLQHRRPMSTATFRRRLFDDLSPYLEPLDAVDHIPDTRAFVRHFRELDQEGRAKPTLDAIAQRLHYFDPPAAPKTPEPLTATETGSCKHQTRNGRTRESVIFTLGITEFHELFGTALLTDLFIAGHRWPNGKPECATCGTDKTNCFRYTTSGDSTYRRFRLAWSAV